MHKPSLSVVTPTFLRPEEVVGLLENIALQSLQPTEVILIDGAPYGVDATENAVRSISAN